MNMQHICCSNIQHKYCEYTMLKQIKPAVPHDLIIVSCWSAVCTYILQRIKLPDCAMIFQRRGSKLVSFETFLSNFIYIHQRNLCELKGVLWLWWGSLRGNPFTISASKKAKEFKIATNSAFHCCYELNLWLFFPCCWFEPLFMIC